MREPIFVINAGSSSVKFSVYQTASDRSVEPGAHGQVGGIGTSPRLRVAAVQGRVLADQVVAGKDYAGAIAEIHDWFRTYVGSETALDGIGHRVVHGGCIYFRPVMIDERVIAGLEELVPLAPLHQPHHIAAIRAFANIAPKVSKTGTDVLDGPTRREAAGGHDSHCHPYPLIGRRTWCFGWIA